MALTQTQSAEGRTIQKRHAFFARKMVQELRPSLLDKTRVFGEIEREIVYFSNDKRCAVCEEEIRWPELEIHHVDEHHVGGQTNLDNAAPVHKDCHPKVPSAVEEFKEKWAEKKRRMNMTVSERLLQELDEQYHDSRSN